MNSQSLSIENSQATATDSFSAKLGFRFGVVPSLVIGRVVACQNPDSQAEPCRNTTQSVIARSFRYLKPATVVKAIEKLKDKEVLIHQERTMEELVLGVDRSFTVAPSVREAARITPVRFRISDALGYGLRAAIVLWDLEAQWHASAARNPEHLRFEFSPTAMSKRIPLGISTIVRKTKALEAAGVLEARCAGWSSGAGRYVGGAQ